MASVFIILLYRADKSLVETVFKAGKYLTFRVAGQNFVLNLAFIRGILPVHQMITTSARGWVMGTAAVSGHNFPVVDLQAKLEIARGPHGKEPVIVVVEQGENLAGFIADRVTEVLPLRERDFRNGAVRLRGRARQVLDPVQIFEKPRTATP